MKATALKETTGYIWGKESYQDVCENPTQIVIFNSKKEFVAIDYAHDERGYYFATRLLWDKDQVKGSQYGVHSSMRVYKTLDEALNDAKEEIKNYITRFSADAATDIHRYCEEGVIPFFNEAPAETDYKIPAEENKAKLQVEGYALGDNYSHTQEWSQLMEDGWMKVEQPYVQEYLDALKKNDVEKLKFIRSLGEEIHKRIHNMHWIDCLQQCGYTDYKFDEYGWVKEPKYKYRESISLRLENEGKLFNKATFIEFPNKTFAYGTCYRTGNGGGSGSASIFDERFPSLYEAKLHALSWFKGYFTENLNNNDSCGNFKKPYMKKVLVKIDAELQKLKRQTKPTMPNLEVPDTSHNKIFSWKKEKFNINIYLLFHDGKYCIQWDWHVQQREGGSIGDSFTSGFVFESKAEALNTVIGKVNQSILDEVKNFTHYNWASFFIAKCPEAAPELQTKPTTENVDGLKQIVLPFAEPITTKQPIKDELYGYHGKDRIDRQRMKRKLQGWKEKLLALPKLERAALIKMVSELGGW